MTEVLPPLHEGSPLSDDQSPERPANTGRRAVAAVVGLLTVLALGIATLALHPTRARWRPRPPPLSRPLRPA